MVLPSQCCIQSYFEAGILVWNPKLRPLNCQKCFWCKFLSPFLVPEPQEQCFEIFRMQNSQKFPGLCTWTPLGRAYNTPNPPTPTYTGQKTRTPKKLLDMALHLQNCLCLLFQYKEIKIFNKYGLRITLRIGGILVQTPLGTRSVFWDPILLWGSRWAWGQIKNEMQWLTSG